MKKHEEKNYASEEFQDGGASVVLEFIFSERLQFRTFIYEVVEISTGYPNIFLLSQNVNL